eukprot:10236201-Lingulodinium_polyedra.AAC.1
MASLSIPSVKPRPARSCMRHSVRTARPVVPTCRWTTWNTTSSGFTPLSLWGRRSCGPPVPTL